MLVNCAQDMTVQGSIIATGMDVVLDRTYASVTLDGADSGVSMRCAGIFFLSETSKFCTFFFLQNELIGSFHVSLIRLAFKNAMSDSSIVWSKIQQVLLAQSTRSYRSIYFKLLPFFYNICI